jgi:hypothetical protein
MRKRLVILGLFVVFPIAALIWAVLIPPGLARWDRAAYESCNAKLKQIYAAQLIWCDDHGGDTNMLVSIADLAGPDGYFGKPPACPEGGTYTLGRVGDYPQCSIPMHSMEFGRVVVLNESGAPMAGAEVSLRLPNKPPRHCRTDHTGAAFLTAFPASEATAWAGGKVSAQHSGYDLSTVELPSKWPVLIVLKRQ